MLKSYLLKCNKRSESSKQRCSQYKSLSPSISVCQVFPTSELRGVAGNTARIADVSVCSLACHAEVEWEGLKDIMCTFVIDNKINK